MADFDFNSLFEDPALTGFGCVLFDMVEVDGRMIPAPGKGWQSVGGGKATRFSDVSELSSDVKWLTNLDRATFWKSGSIKQKKLRESSFFRTDLGQLIREMGIVPKKVSVAWTCERVSELFSRTMMWGMTHYDISELKEQEWCDEIRPLLAPGDSPISMEVDEALRRCFTEFIPCATSRIEGAKLVTLRRPRIAHAKAVMESAIPVGAWSFIPPGNLPEAHNRFDELWDMQKPMLVKVAVRGYSEKCPGHVLPLLQFGEAIGEGGRKKERNWITLQEYKYLAKFMKLEIQAVFQAEGWDSFHGARKVLELGDLSPFSVSMGLLSEAHWIALSSRTRHPTTKSKTMVSPRAAWFRAADRFLCFCSALPLAAAGFSIVSYGGGCVSVAVLPERMLDLAQSAAACGLSAPEVLFG